VAGDDGALGVEQDGVGEAEALDAVGDLAELPGRVGAGVARGGAERGERLVLDAQRGAGEVG
jgi:hypothetical protein